VAQERCAPVIAPNSRQKFEKKDYRNAYMAGRVRTSIALQIRALREQRQLSQTEFAHLVQKPQSVVSRLENTEYGRVTVQTLLDIASSLDIALIVKFSTFREFFAQMSDTSDRALMVESFSSKQLDAPPIAPLDESLHKSLQLSLSRPLLLQLTERAGQSFVAEASDIYQQELLPILRPARFSEMRNAA
jgi:transcriptional regulator with XRE-family HTH domain